MSIQDICNFITNYREEERLLVKTFDLKEDQILSDTEEKTIRSAIVRFHLTAETPLVVSYRIQKRTILKEISKIKVESYLGRIIVPLTALTACAAIFSCGLSILQSQLLISSSKDTQDALSQNYLTESPEDLSSKNENSIVLFGVFIGQVLSIQIICLKYFSFFFKDIYKVFHTVLYKNFHSVEISFRDEELFFCKHLANNESADKIAYIDPISFDTIPKDRIRLRRYLHPTNYVIDTSSCIKAILRTNLKTDGRGLKYADHPIERGEFHITSRLEFENEICQTFGFDSISKFYECWSLNGTQQDELTQRDRELKFLNLFDTDIHKLLPSIEPPQPSEHI